MTRNGRLSFELNFRAAELNLVDLPVEVRKPNLALVARALSSQTVEVEPGSYFVTATLPAGQELTEAVEVGEGAHRSVRLSPEPEDESPHESHGFAHFFLGARAAALKGVRSLDDAPPGLESLGGPAVEGRLRLFSGNALGGRLRQRDDLLPRQPHTSDGLTGLEIPGVGEPLLAQLVQPNARPLNVALPASENRSCKLILKLLPDGTHTLDVQLEHGVADLLLRYSEQGRFNQVVAAVDSLATSAEALLKQKRRDPVAAAVGAYSVLRFGALEQLHDWTRNLWNWFPWLPDGAAVWGEHLARLGRHEEALEVFLGLPGRGLPFFSDGLSYAADRLRFCERLGEREFGAETLARVGEALGLLQPFIPYTDFGKPVLTYTGLDPSRPDDEPLEDAVAVQGGLDLAALAGRRGAEGGV